MIGQGVFKMGVDCCTVFFHIAFLARLSAALSTPAEALE